MLLVQSLVLSLSITWRWLIFGTVYFTILAGFIYLFWYLAFFLVTLFTPVLIAMLQLLTLRAGLAGHGMMKGSNFGRLIGASFKYGGFFFLLSLLFWFVFGSLFYILDHYYAIGAKVTATGLFNWVGDFPNEYLLFMPMSLFGLTYVCNTIVLWLFYSAMLIPMTARAHSCNKNAPVLDFFWGFGHRVGLIMVLQILSIVLLIGLSAIIPAATYAYTLALDGFSENTILAFGIGVLIVMALLMIWASSIPYAGAVILFDRLFKAHTEENSPERRVERMSVEELRALRKSRL